MGYDALYTGISGLDAYQQEINVISNNIANAGTTGFKSQRVTFDDAFYQTVSQASAPTANSGGTNGEQLGVGVQVGSIDTIFTQGGLQTTNVPTDVAINGDGFFILNNTAGTGTPTYTRNGAFSINTDGTLYDPGTGLAVQGFMANSSGVISSTGTPGVITLPVGLAQQATATGGLGAVKLGPTDDKNFDMTMGGALDETQYEAEAVTAGTGQAKTITTTIYDSLGNAHQATITFSPVSPLTPPATALPAQVDNGSGVATNVGSRWSYKMTFTDGTTPTNNSGYIFFDQNGQYINTSSQADPATPATDVHTIGTAPSVLDGNVLTIAAGAWPTGDGSIASTIGLDFSSMSSLSGSSTANVLAQNGFPPGVLSNISVGQDGTITGAFTNGQQKAIARIALATFQNEGGLQRVQGGFNQTDSSGLAQVGTANQGRYGSMVGGSLEESNVNLADEFTNLISAQRAFEANSRSISTADQDQQDVVNLHASTN